MGCGMFIVCAAAICSRAVGRLKEFATSLKVLLFTLVAVNVVPLNVKELL